MLDVFSSLEPYIFTYGGAQLFMLLATFVLLPLLWYKIIRKKFESGVAKFASTLAIWGMFWIIGYGDVVYIAWHAKELCQTETGPRVYRTAEVDGFFGNTSISYWSEYGFSYVEYGGAWDYRRKTTVDGEDVVQKIDEPISQYEYAVVSQRVAPQIFRYSKVVRDRVTHEVLGDYVAFAIYPGWADGLFLGLGFTFSPQYCYAPGKPPGSSFFPDIRAFIKTILKPIQKPEDERP